MSETIQILIDGNACGYASHNMDPMTTADGTQVQAVIGFLETLAHLRKEFPTANLVVLWDGKSWRSDVLASYKESRDPDLSEFDLTKPMTEAENKRYKTAAKKAASRAAYKKQGPMIEEALRYLAVPQITCFNYEADDLAALFADRYVDKGHPVRLVTSDGDWMQLIQNRVVWKANRTPFTFVSNANFHAKAKVGKVVGFTPKTFLQAKLLYGDAGDCVPGIAGFGEVTLSRFFASYVDLDRFFDMPIDRAASVYSADHGKKIPACVMELHEKGNDCAELELARTLMDLRTSNRPEPGDLKIERGVFDRAGLLNLTKRLDLYRLSSDIDRFMRTFQGV
jgi:5'-3' exonuclease